MREGQRLVHSSGLASTEATGPRASVSLALMRMSDVEAPDRRRCHGRHKIPASKGEEGWWSAQTAAASEELQPGDASPPHRRGDGVPARRPICANGPNGKCEASTRRLAACGRSTRARTSHPRANRGLSAVLFTPAFEAMKTTMYPKQHDHASHRCGGAGRL